MKIHENKKEFKQILEEISNKTGMDIQMIEKDYYLSLILKGISEKLDFLVFKGGTSLSKCFKIINRFSEDIDIAVNEHITQSQRKKVKLTIKEVCDTLGLEISNYDGIQSRHVFNRYEIKYPSCLNFQVFGSNASILKPNVLLETTYTTISFPTSEMEINSLVGEYIKENYPQIFSSFDLGGFNMQVQSVERTLVDKIFAICDYYLQDKVSGHSRHLYDIYKLIQVVNCDDNFEKLVNEVRAVRKESPVCLSAKDDVDIEQLLKDIIMKEIYRDDYEKITIKLLAEEIPYEETVQAIKEIIDSRCFQKSEPIDYD